MSVNVKNILELPSLRGAKVLGGKQSLDRIVNSISVLEYAKPTAMDGTTLKKYGVKNIVTRSENLGKAIRKLKESKDEAPEDAFLRASEGVKIFRGKIADVLRETNGAFNLGHGDQADVIPVIS